MPANGDAAEATAPIAKITSGSASANSGHRNSFDQGHSTDAAKHFYRFSTRAGRRRSGTRHRASTERNEVAKSTGYRWPQAMYEQ
jgi:hypothetical protein